MSNTTAATSPLQDKITGGGGGHYRDQTVDIVKGIAIFLMVWGHTDGPFSNWIYLFHMAVFMIASGYCWNDRHAADGRAFGRYVLHKLRTLYLAYVCCNGLNTLLNPLFVKIRLYSHDMLLSPKRQLIELGKNFFFGGGSGFAGATWFIRALFFVTIGHAALMFLTRKLRARNALRVAAIVLIAAAAQCISTFSIGLPKGLQACFPAYLAYVLGICFKKYFLRYINRLGKLAGAGVMLGSFGVLVGCNFLGSVSIGGGHIENLLFYAVVSSAGWLMLWEASRFIPRAVFRVIGFAGAHSIYVVFLHFIAYRPVSLCYILLTGSSMDLLSSFPTITGVPFLWVPYLVAGFALPVGVAFIVNKIKLLIKRR